MWRSFIWLSEGRVGHRERACEQREMKIFILSLLNVTHQWKVSQCRQPDISFHSSLIWKGYKSHTAVSWYPLSCCFIPTSDTLSYFCLQWVVNHENYFSSLIFTKPGFVLAMCAGRFQCPRLLSVFTDYISQGFASKWLIGTTFEVGSALSENAAACGRKTCCIVCIPCRCSHTVSVNPLKVFAADRLTLLF